MPLVPGVLVLLVWSLPEPQCAGVFEGLESLVPRLLVVQPSLLAAHYKVEDLGQKIKFSKSFIFVLLHTNQGSETSELAVSGAGVSDSSGSDDPGASVSD